MTNALTTASDVAIALQSRSIAQAKDARIKIDASQRLLPQNAGKSDIASDDASARDAAEKFEALLIHNMLKSMRKTTMTEDKSNDRAIYDDMLDEKLADTMIEAGGIGIADQIVAQIREQQGRRIESEDSVTNTRRLRELASHIPRSSLIADNTIEKQTPDFPEQSANLSLATAIWKSDHSKHLDDRQQAFIQPLLPHAIRGARELGTSPTAILAVAALETGWGRSMIIDRSGKDSHNLFGIKASHSDNRFATTLTTEYVDGAPEKQPARFKTFDSHADAVNGFTDFILSNPRYSNALKHADNPERFLQELQSAGYATDPRYAEKAISIMRQIAGNPLPL